MDRKDKNREVAATDWAAANRRQAIRRVGRLKRHKDKELAPNVFASSVWLQDLAGGDRRSVKAQLAGRGDYRAAWWNLNVFLHKLFRPAASLESIMYAFHRRHGEITIWLVEELQAYCEFYNALQNEGFSAGARVWMARMVGRKGE